jgi:hypothetical protein
MRALTAAVVQPLPDFQALTAISSATTTTLVDASGLSAGKVYNVKRVTLYNAHASVTNLVTVQINDGTNTSILANLTLLVGEWMIIDESGNVTHYDSNGGIYSATTPLDVRLRVTADQAFATATTLADITDLSTAKIKNGKKYAFEMCIFSTNNASTTGSQFGVNGPTATTFVVGEVGAVTNSVTAGAVGIGTATAINTVIVGQTTGQTAVGMHHIMGYYEPSADGTFAVRATSEVTVAAGLTVKKGSWLRLWECTN